MTASKGELPRFWFGAPPELLPDEQRVAHHAANRSQGKRAVGGGLHFTTERVLFCPNAVDARLGGRAWSCAIAEVAAVGVEPARYSLLELFSGGLRARLRIDVEQRGPEFFVVSSPAQVAAELQALLAR